MKVKPSPASKSSSRAHMRRQNHMRLSLVDSSAIRKDRKKSQLRSNLARCNSRQNYSLPLRNPPLPLNTQHNPNQNQNLNRNQQQHNRNINAQNRSAPLAGVRVKIVTDELTGQRIGHTVSVVAERYQCGCFSLIEWFVPLTCNENPPTTNTNYNNTNNNSNNNNNNNTSNSTVMAL